MKNIQRGAINRIFTKLFFALLTCNAKPEASPKEDVTPSIITSDDPPPDMLLSSPIKSASASANLKKKRT